MASIKTFGPTIARGRTPSALPPDPSCQPCPDCGGLECLCRPRFFAGQLLSEQDLNRLDHYIVEKNKLHNRHLFGSGVVCGLGVTCAPCDSGFVTVAPGYALSPCGEDIVVCKPDSVDICALIARCRTDSAPDCGPWRGGDQPCDDVVEDWIMAIRYAESPSRGTTPLTGARQGCSCSCGGGCSGGCSGGGEGGCGCGGAPACKCGTAQGVATSPPPAQPSLRRGGPPSCEPTLTCETYRYDVFKAPSEAPKPGGEHTGFAGIFEQLEGDLAARIACCIKELDALLLPPPGDITAITADQRDAWFRWACQIRNLFANFFARTGGTDCEALAKLRAIVIPAPTQPVDAFAATIQQAAQLMALLYFEAVIGCICMNALPPCPPPGDPRVPLALVRVRRGDCQVISICDWTPLRKHVLTFPTLEYWFGWLPIERVLRDLMHTLCCDMFGLRPGRDQQFDVRAEPMMRAAPAPGPAEAPPAQPEFALFPERKIEAPLFEALAARAAKGGSAGFADLAGAFLNRENVSLGAHLVGDARAETLSRVAGSAPLGLFAGMLGPVAPMLQTAMGRQSDIADLKATLARQSEEIAALRVAIGDRQ